MEQPEKIDFKAGSNRLVGLLFNPKQLPDFFFLHGGGKEKGKDKFIYLLDDLYKEDINSFAFDFSGIGESGGELVKSSLSGRVKETTEAIKLFYDVDSPINIGSASMGGYVAIKLAGILNVKNLILFCPAIYDAQAYNTPFTDEFTKIIRKAESWRNSDAIEILKNYKDNLLLIIPENDDVVPRPVTDLIINSANNCRRREIFIIPNSPHNFHSILKSDTKLRENIITKIAEFIKD